MNIQIPTLLDIALSLTFVFFIVSMFVSGIWEFIGTILQDKRARLLLDTFEKMLGDPNFATLLYNHPLIKGHIVERPLQWLEKVLAGSSDWKISVEDKQNKDKWGATNQYKLALQKLESQNLPTTSDIETKVQALKVNALNTTDANVQELRSQISELENDKPKTVDVTPIDFSKGLLTRLVKFDKDEKVAKVINTPSYIAATVFSRVLLGLLHGLTADNNNTPPATLAQIQAEINALGKNQESGQTDITGLDLKAQMELQRILTALIQDASDVKGFVGNIENWYTEYMTRLSGYYKQYSQQGIRWVAIVVVLLLNLDAFNLTIRLYRDPALRAAVVTEAQNFSKKIHADSLNTKQAQEALKGLNDKQAKVTPPKKDTSDSVNSPKPKGTTADTPKKTSPAQATTQKGQSTTAPTASENAQYLANDLDYLKKLPFGWARLSSDYDKAANKVLYILTVILGWVLMVGAVSFGAPFWFDLLLKLVNIRNVGKNPAEKT